GLELAHAALLLARDPVDEREHGLLDELDQPFEHLRLAAEVTVERRLGEFQPRRKSRGGDSLPGRILQHLRQRLQDLVLALPRPSRHAAPPYCRDPSMRGNSMRRVTLTSTQAGVRADLLTHTVFMPSRAAVRRFSRLSSTMIQR